MRKKTWNPKLSRRDFLKLSGAVVAGAAFFDMPHWVWATAGLAANNSKILITLFQ